MDIERSSKAEMPLAPHGTESPVQEQRLMQEVLERGNLLRALHRVERNKGAAGVDGMSVGRLRPYLMEHWPAIRVQLLDGTYKPKPVRRVEIPKDGGGVRELGIPTVLDRFIQQALAQVLDRYWDPTFSEHSYGFRRGRSAHQAVAKAQKYVEEGYEHVVDLDIEKFFDRVNHDKLMALVAERVADKSVLRLIRAYLQSGVMLGGLVEATHEGTPQGGPLSPLLSNLLLDQLDRELERRGHRFVRYADDCNIYVRSARSGQRVMESVRRFLAKRLKLKVNEAKSAVARPAERKFLGFTLIPTRKGVLRSISETALKKFRRRFRPLTRRTRGRSLPHVVRSLRPSLNGWLAYFRFCQTPSQLRDLATWIRRRLRAYLWKQWRTSRQRYRQLVHRGVSDRVARCLVASSHGPWRLSKSSALHVALPNAYFRSLGLPAFTSTT